MKKQEMIQKIREIVILANNPKCKTYKEYIRLESKKSSETKGISSIEFIGLPLTMERVLGALNYCAKDKFSKVYGINYHSDKKRYFISNFRLLHEKGIICYIELSKNLEEQSDVTIEAIAKELGVKL